jgi:hypothetical protein
MSVRKLAFVGMLSEHVAVFDLDGLTDSVGHGILISIPVIVRKKFFPLKSGAPTVAKKVDVETLAITVSVQFAGFNQPIAFL